MTVKERLLPMLFENRDRFISGEEEAEKLGVSRTAVWKAIASLKEDGYKITAVTNKGYRLEDDCDVLSKTEIERFAGSLADRLNITVKQTVTSTNAVLKEKADGLSEGTVLIASEQISGRGRFTRKFYSPSGSGIYMSIFLRPSLSAADSVLITTAAAVAVSLAAEELSGRKTGIKWVNDVLIGGKKVCGILTEAALDIESGKLNYAVLGIGLNAYEPDGGFPDEIKEIAGAIFEKRSDSLKNKLAAKVLTYFFRFYDTLDRRDFLKIYRERSIVTGKKILVVSADKKIPATAIGIDGDCRLEVLYDDGRREFLSSGEISTELL